MSTYVEHYKTLGVSFDAGFAEVTSSYRRLCRIYHPDISNNPESEELMKQINTAYTVLKEKFRREAFFGERQGQRQTRRPSGTGTQPRQSNTDLRRAQMGEQAAMDVLSDYFGAIKTQNYSAAYFCLSSYDKLNISQDSFVKWRKSVARMYPLMDFTIQGGFSVVTLNRNNTRTIYARKFRMVITESDIPGAKITKASMEKLVIFDNNLWRVFLGYKGVSDITQSFDERFEHQRKRDVEKNKEEAVAVLHLEYNMFNLEGLKKVAEREIYRQKRFAGALTLAVISIKNDQEESENYDELIFDAAKTINKVLRQTDTPAYIGNGTFALLLVELKKKNAEEIIKRIINKIRENSRNPIMETTNITYNFASWSGKTSASKNALNLVLHKFDKFI